MSVIETLATAANHPDPEVRAAALRASARLGHPAAATWVFAGFRDPVASVRSHAIAASTRLGLRDAVPELRRLLADEELSVRLRAEQAIEQFEAGAEKTAPVDLAV